jgi:hypothetical protein
MKLDETVVIWVSWNFVSGIIDRGKELRGTLIVDVLVKRRRLLGPRANCIERLETVVTIVNSGLVELMSSSLG